VCAFLHSQTLLATAGDDRTVRIWEPGTRKRLAIISVHDEAPAITWDGTRLATALSAGLPAIRPPPPLLGF